MMIMISRDQEIIAFVVPPTSDLTTQTLFSRFLNFCTRNFLNPKTPPNYRLNDVVRCNGKKFFSRIALELEVTPFGLLTGKIMSEMLFTSTVRSVV